jgi:hypothetical protein
MFQKARGLTQDGDVGPNTLAQLQSVYSSDTPEISPGMGGPVPDLWHNAFWRTLDQRTNFAATPVFAADRNAFMLAGNNAFMPVVKGRAPQATWDTAVFSMNATGVVARMAAVQSGVAYERYGKPVPVLTLLDAFERFGQDNLPVDPLHPGPGNKHNMDGGQFLWMQWVAFADAAIKSGVELGFYTLLRRCILAGFWLDGLRVGFTVKTPVGPTPSLSDIQSLTRTQTDAQIEVQLREQCDASLPSPDTNLRSSRMSMRPAGRL